MRIAFLTPEYATEKTPDGGLGNYLAKICSLFQSLGHDPVVFTVGEASRRERINGVQVVSIENSTGNRWWLRGPARRGRLPLRLLDNARHLEKAFRADHARQPFDVIQAASYAAVGVALAGRSVIPLVIRVSSFTPLLRLAYGRRATLAESLADRLELRALRRAQAVFCPSRLMASTIERVAGIRARVIPSPFVMPTVEEDEGLFQSLPAHLRYFLFFGTMSRIKGIDLLAEALPKILVAHREVHAVFIGRDDGLPDGRSCSELLMEAAGASGDRVHLLGRQPQARLLPILRRAEVVVLPSRVDNYPNACLEAQAMGRIVVGTRGSSLEEMIEDGVTGFLADVESAESLANALNRALSLDGNERLAMETAVAALTGRRDPAAQAEELLAFYAEAIGEWKSKGRGR